MIFLTAYEQHALRAFEVHALDYLLKPVDDERFAAAVAHARNFTDTVSKGLMAKRLLRLLGRVLRNTSPVSQFAPVLEFRLFSWRTSNGFAPQVTTPNSMSKAAYTFYVKR